MKTFRQIHRNGDSMTYQTAHTGPTPQSAVSEKQLNDARTIGVVAVYRTVLPRLIGKPIYGSFELLMLWSVVDSVVTLRRHGVHEADPCIASAARHALACIEQRCDPAGPFNVLPEERVTLDELLRMHEAQISSERFSVLMLAQSAKDGIGAKATHRGSTGFRRASAARHRSQPLEGIHA